MASQVRHWRWHPGNPDEAAAQEVFEEWEAAGWEPRQIITQAMMALSGQPIPEPTEESAVLSEVQAALREIRREVKKLSELGGIPSPGSNTQAIKRTAKSKIGAATRNLLENLSSRGYLPDDEEE